MAEQRRNRPGAGWPFACPSSGVHPSQVPAERERLRKLGVRIDFNAAGNPIFESPGQRQAYLRAIGMVDKDSYGGKY